MEVGEKNEKNDTGDINNNTRIFTGWPVTFCEARGAENAEEMQRRVAIADAAHANTRKHPQAGTHTHTHTLYQSTSLQNHNRLASSTA